MCTHARTRARAKLCHGVFNALTLASIWTSGSIIDNTKVCTMMSRNHWRFSFSESDSEQNDTNKSNSNSSSSSSSSEAYSDAEDMRFDTKLRARVCTDRSQCACSDYIVQLCEYTMQSEYLRFRSEQSAFRDV